MNKIVLLMTLIMWQGVLGAFACADEPAVAIAEEVTANKQITWYTPDKWRSLGSIGFRLSDFPEDSFILVFPEWITAREMSWHVPAKWEFNGRTAKGTWQSEDYSLTLELQFSSTGQTRALEWEITFRNDSKAELTDVAAFNCFNLVDAPSFKDLKMERTYVSSPGKEPVHLSEVKKIIGPRTLQFYPARGGLNLPEFERFGRYQATGNVELAGDRISVRSVDGRWTVQSIVSGPVAYFFNNWEADHGCVHAAPLLGDIPSGKSAMAQGEIRFAQEKPAE